MVRKDDDKPEEPRPRTRRPGLPDPESVVSEKTVISPKGKPFRIIETTENDATDPPSRLRKKK